MFCKKIIRFLLLHMLAAAAVLGISAQSLALPNLPLHEREFLTRLCAAGDTGLLSGAGRRKVMVFDPRGSLSPLHDSLPLSLRADSLASTAVVLCLALEEETIETCSFGIFTVPRIQPLWEASAWLPARPGLARSRDRVEGSPPPACSTLSQVSAETPPLRGGAPGEEEFLAFLAGLGLEGHDRDADGLNALEEFLVEGDPLDAGSPGLAAAVRANGARDITLYEGDTLSFDVSLYPGEAIGRRAEYRVWAETPMGLFNYRHPSGFRKAQEPEVSVTAPLIKLLDHPLISLALPRAGDYVLHFEVDGGPQAIAGDTAVVTVLPDACRLPVGLPAARADAWTAACSSVHAPGRLARYYPFKLSAQSSIGAELTGAGKPGQLLLLAGAGRNGQLIARGTQGAASAALFLELPPGSYTLETVSPDSAPKAFRLSMQAGQLPWRFTEVTVSAGFNYSHGYSFIESGIFRDLQVFAGGVAAGDYDQDGWIDLYVTRGSIGANLLFRNRGDASFEEVGEAAGVAISGIEGTGAVFGDYDGDGWPDLFVGAMNGDRPTLFRNRGDGTFEDVTAGSGLGRIINAMSGTFHDHDLDGDLDLYVPHWTASQQKGAYLWRNEGNGTFTDVSRTAGIPDDLVADYSANFTDIDDDGWPDLLVAADFGTSQVFLNRGNGTFRNVTGPVISDENGMGAAVGDYDNDGDMDWFVSSIFKPQDVAVQLSWGESGNRFYRNEGGGTFSDVTDATGTRLGGWGWGSCFADFNNDGLLDLFHVNGYTSTNPFAAPYEKDLSRLFIATGDGSFKERSAEVDLIDDGQGRGIVCFDYDRDGDIDIFVANNEQPPSLFRNDGGNKANFLQLRVEGEAKNSAAIGARIEITAGGLRQMRDLRAGSNYMSQDPAEAHFGLGPAAIVDEVRVTWPSGRERILRDVPANQFIAIPAP